MGSVSGSGGTSVEGALIVSGSIPNTMSGSIDVWYNSDMLDALKKLGDYTGAAGTWHDW